MVVTALLLPLLALPGLLPAASAEEAAADDPRIWMEEVLGDRPLGWVREQNEVTMGAYARTPAFEAMQARMLAALDSTERIPWVTEMNGVLYNFWQDAEHPQGVWRRTSWDEYRKPSPQWEVVLDLDALSQTEGERWVWHGARCLPPEAKRCLLELSPGGQDASVIREFDTTTRSFVPDGFTLPVAKSDVDWISIDQISVATDFGPGSLTDSGYPRIAKAWKRGTPLSAADELYAGEAKDIWVGAFHDDTPGYERDFVYRALTFYTNELYERTAKGLVKVEKPDDCEASFFGPYVLFNPRSDWEVGGQKVPAGALVAADHKAWKKGKRQVEVLFSPTDRTSLAGFTTTKNTVVLEILDNVRSKVEVLRPGKKGWTRAAIPGLPELGQISVSAVDERVSDDLWVTLTDYLTPSSLAVSRAGAAPERLKASPAFFQADGLTVTQHMATSADGTAVPYFQVGPEKIPDGGLPTLLYGYGGFEVSLLPVYSATAGIGWIEPGGVYVVANIRGGGEFGPRWHQAALRENRSKAYEDFAAVGDDLVKRGVTTRPQLGIMGGSNGGLLMGNMYTMYPERWGAIVCQVPLLDMKRYTGLLAGASWAGEYGDPKKPEDWAFLQRYSPYHNVDPAKSYPPILFTTSTRDDRVHPGHARKMAALLGELGKDVAYYENIEGGHGGAANNAQQAFMRTLGYQFLWERLRPPAAPAPAPAP